MGFSRFKVNGGLSKNMSNTDDERKIKLHRIKKWRGPKFFRKFFEKTLRKKRGERSRNLTCPSKMAEIALT